MKNLKLLIFILAIGLSHQMNAQEVWQVDSRVTLTAEKSGGYTILEVVVKVDNDDAARSPKLVVTLPRNSKVNGITFDKGMEQTPYHIMGNASQALPQDLKPQDSYVQVDLRNLNKEEVKMRISIVPTRGKYLSNSSAAAFLFGITPELNKKNNYSIVTIL